MKAIHSPKRDPSTLKRKSGRLIIYNTYGNLNFDFSPWSLELRIFISPLAKLGFDVEVFYFWCFAQFGRLTKKIEYFALIAKVKFPVKSCFPKNMNL